VEAIVKSPPIRRLEARHEYGFFGLDELHQYFKEDVSPVFESFADGTIILDFTKIVYWDISALLWLVVGLDHLQKRNSVDGKNIRFRLQLPQPGHPEIPIKQMEKQDQLCVYSADYLRRWRFIDALKNLADSPDDLLVESQAGYISGEPLHYFPRRLPGRTGLQETLLSLRLVEIRNLVDIAGLQSKRRINKNRCDNIVTDFITTAIADVLNNCCGISKDIANTFVTHLVSEGLENALQHPNANIGMISLSITGKDNLVVAIADNGESICQTIYEHYRRGQSAKGIELPCSYTGLSLPSEIRRDLLNHATKEGVSRKTVSGDQQNWQEISLKKVPGSVSQIGMGLTHIRDAAVRDFGGDLMIISEGIRVKFATVASNDDNPELKDFNFAWPGNLLRIQFPTVQDLWKQRMERRRIM
jgi:hypothetical protein